MVNLPFAKKQLPTVQREAVTAAHGKGFLQRMKEAASKGQVSTNQWTDKQPHPPNMGKYPIWASDPQVRIAIDLKTDMVAGTGYYVQMPEKDRAGKTVDPEHKNIDTIENYLKDIGFRDKYKQIQRQKYEMGFCAVERLSDGKLKVLPSDTIYIWRTKLGKVNRYTQEYNNQVVAEWIGDDPNFIMFIHNEDPLHPYGHAVTDSIGGLIDANDQINVDMPKIIHRYSSPLGIWECSRDITTIKQAVVERDVDEDVFIGNVEKDEVRQQFIEPSTQVKFLEYIDQINFQIGQALHAPLILLLKNATEASATKMLESVDRANSGEQEQNADIIEQRLFLPVCGEPVPEFLHGATDEVLKGVTLTDIGTLKGNSTITWKQAQDLIRKKGIDLIEDVQPQPLPILNQAPPNDPNNPDQKPMLNKDKINQADLALQTVKASFENKNIGIAEALKEGDRIIRVYVDKAKREATRQVKESTGLTLAPETEQHFELIRQTLFAEFRNSLLPTGVKLDVPVQSYTVTPNR
jgi:hypothetical protein